MLQLKIPLAPPGQPKKKKRKGNSNIFKKEGEVTHKKKSAGNIPRAGSVV